MKMWFLWVAVALGLIAMLLTPRTSEASSPIYKPSGEETSVDQPKVVPDASVRWTYYADLAPGKVDVYQIYAQQGQQANPSLAVPKISNLASFTPTMTLVGPGLSSTAAAANTGPGVSVTYIPSNTLASYLPAGVGAKLGGMPGVTIDYTGDPQARQVVSDGSTQISLWQGQLLNMDYPSTSAYYLLVWDKSSKGGQYTLSVGGEDESGLGDVIKTPYTWAKAHLWVGDTVPVIISAIVLILIIAAIVFLLVRRPRKLVVRAEG
ncbi:MAG: hypothetical protein IVW55_15655 [Chloroflexi bacterium]|nr:hypothetical protein [Chloroflexota bacterium]